MSRGKRLPDVAAWRNALRDSDLGRTAVLVGLVLSTYMDKNGRCLEKAPSKATLAKGARLAYYGDRGGRAVDGAIDALDAAGFLTVHRNRKPFRYEATVPAMSRPAATYNGGSENPVCRISRAGMSHRRATESEESATATPPRSNGASSPTTPELDPSVFIRTGR
jgi:hypothetical protein